MFRNIAPPSGPSAHLPESSADDVFCICTPNNVLSWRLPVVGQKTTTHQPADLLDERRSACTSLEAPDCS